MEGYLSLYKTIDIRKYFKVLNIPFMVIMLHLMFGLTFIMQTV